MTRRIGRVMMPLPDAATVMTTSFSHAYAVRLRALRHARAGALPARAGAVP